MAVNNTHEKKIFKNDASFTSFITEIKITEVDYTEDIDIVMPMYNVIQYYHAYLKTSCSLWQYYRDEPALDDNGDIINFPAKNNDSNPFKFKQQITG